MAPVVHLGWVLAAAERDHDVLQAYELAHSAGSSKLPRIEPS
jgi:hypothetical protein